MSYPRCADDVRLPLGDSLAARLGEGCWRPGPDSAIGIWRDGALQALVLPSSAGGDGVNPGGAELSGTVCYALNTREVQLPFGAAGIGIAVVQREPRVEASLGMNGHLKLRLAHATGLWPLLENGAVEKLGWQDAMGRLRQGVVRALSEAVRACCGDMPWDYEALERAFSSGELREAAGKRLFWALYPCGLAARPRDVRLLGLAYSPDEAPG